MRADFAWRDGERLIRFAPGALADAPALLAQRGFEGYALLTSPRVRGAAPAVVEGAAVMADVPRGSVPEAAAAVREEVRGRPLVALGGGRVIDSAKAIAAADGVPCAAVPSTLSGAELTGIHRLPAGVEGARLVRPSLVIADPELMAGQPMPELAASAMNSLGHAIEALYVPSAHPVAELAGLRAAELIGSGLSSPEPDRLELALGSLLGAYALGATGLALHHVVCQTLVRVAGTPHAQTNAVMLPHCVGLMAGRAPEAIGRLAVAIGASAPESTLAADLVAALAVRAGVTRLGELGVDPDSLPRVVETALARPQLAATPRPPDREELLALLRGAL